MSKIKILPTQHFVERLGERGFDLAVIAKLYMELAKQPKAKMLEVSSGNATVVAEVREDGVVKLITGWTGNRKHTIGN